MASYEEMSAIVRAGGNLEPGHVFDPRATPMVRKKTEAELKEDADAVKLEKKLSNQVVITAPEVVNPGG